MVQCQAQVKKCRGKETPGQISATDRAPGRPPSFPVPPSPVTPPAAVPCPGTRPCAPAPSRPPLPRCDAGAAFTPMGRRGGGPCPSPRKVCPWFPHLKLPRRARSLPRPRGGAARRGWGAGAARACAGDGRPAPGTRGDSGAGTACDTAQVGPLLPRSSWLRAGGCRAPAEVREGRKGRETRPSPRGQPQLGPRAQAPEMGGWADGQSWGV